MAKQCCYYNFFNHEKEKRTKVTRIPFSDSDLLQEAAQYFHLWLQWELFTKGTDEHSVQEPTVWFRGKKNKWTHLYPILNKNWMLPRVLKHLENLLLSLLLILSFHLFLSRWERGKEAGKCHEKVIFSWEIYVRRTSAFFHYEASIPMSHT